jgi:tRNA nucleotidyltransferase (CCA-adding enzyme)
VDDIRQDLARRDFTVNAMAYAPSRGYEDPFGGREDLQNRCLRAVGDPETRFTEDALRILRGLRFSSVLSFSIDEETEKAMFKCKSLLNNISKERVFIELSKMLCGRNIKEVLLKYSEILSVVLPEIKDMKGFEQHNFHHIYDVLEHTAVVVESAPPLPHLRFSALLHDCGKPDCFSIDKDGVGHFYSHASISAEKAEKALLRLKSDNKTKDKVVKLIKLHDAPIEENEVVIKKKLSKYGEELFFDLIELKRADTKGLAPEFHSREEHFDKLESIAKKVLSEKPCFTLKSLSINGNDLAELGFEGAEIGKCLKLLLNEVIENRTENNKEALKNKALLIKNSEASS